MPTARAAGFALSLLVAALALPAIAGAADGSLTVTVRDNYGVIPRATVRATNAATGASQRVVTDDAGVARFAALPAATLRGAGELPGLRRRGGAGRDPGRGRGEVARARDAVAPSSSTTLTVETANRREQLLLDVAEPVTLIERTQIEDTGARSAKDVLVEQNGSGIQVNAGGGQGYVSINGIPNKGVLVLVNGRRYLGKDANGNLNLEELRLPGIERIEVVKGAGSALYGSDALGGVVNFITDEPTERGVTNTLTVSGGSYDDYRVDDSFSWRGSRGGVSLAGGYRTYDGFDLESCTPELQASTGCKPNPQTIGQPPSTYWNASGTADFEITKKVVARFFGDYQLREVRDYFFSGATQLASTVYDSQRDLTRYTLSPEVDFLLSPRTSFNATYTYGKYLRDETRVFVSDGRVVPQPEWREWNQEAKLTGRHAWPAFGREHPLQGGYEYRNEKLQRGSLSGRGELHPVDDPVSEAADINVLWGQQELNLTSRLTAHRRAALRQLQRLRRRVEPQGRGRLHPRPGAPPARQLRPRLPAALLRRAVPQQAARSSSATPTSSRRSRTASPAATPSRARRRRSRWTATTPR